MRRITAVVSALALTVAAAIAPHPASAQEFPPGSTTCEAVSAYATGVWTHYNGQYACRRALRECAARTPYGYACYVNRWWLN